MICKLILLSLGLASLGTASRRLQHDVKQDVETPYGQPPYYSGYPFYHSGYSLYYGGAPFHHYQGHFRRYFPYYAPVPQVKAPVKTHGPSYLYNGIFDGECYHDGLYYVDTRSFVFCHNRRRTVQSCADGAANEEKGHYTSGKIYSMNDFCSVNLLALAATATGSQ